MRKVLAALVALSMVASLFTGVVAPIPATRAAGPAAVVLGTAGDFTILAKTAITNVPTSEIAGSIGVSPVAATAITGFALIMDSTNQFSTSSQVTGRVYAADYAVPTPANMTTAVNDMVTAYNAAAGETVPAPIVGLGAGDISGMTLAPALYKWSTGVLINADVTLSGSASDVWIFQIAGDLSVASGGSIIAGTKVLLSGGAQASNVFWQVGGGTGATLGTYSTFQGTILTAKQIIMQTGAVLYGRALAQTQVTLDANVVSAPAQAGGEGTITIIKNTVPNGPQDFSFTISGNNDTLSFILDDDADPTWSNTAIVYAGSGTYTITETAVAGYTLTGIFGATSFNLTTRVATVVLDEGMPAATVTFTNMQSGTITIIKDTVSNGPQDFSFTMTSDSTQTTFSLDDDADPTLLNWTLFGGLLPGTYTITEAPVEGYTLTGIAGATSFNLGTRTATVALTAGGAATVTFTNTGESAVSLLKAVSPTGAVLPGARLNYTLIYSNTGTAATSDLIITDVLDGWLDESTLSIGQGGSYNSSTRTMTWNVGIVPAGGSGTVTFAANVRSIPGVFLLIRNTGFYSATIGGTGHSNTVETPVLVIIMPPEEEPVPPPPPPSIAIDVTAQDPLCANAYLPYRICFTNGTLPYTYTVNFGDGTPIVTGTTSSSCVTLEHAYLDLQQYSLKVTVRDSKGMESTYQESFTTEDCFKKVVVYHHNFFIGYPNGTFQPEGNITRAEMAAAMSRALGLGWSVDQPSFFDVTPEYWSAGHIALMRREGFMLGDPAGTFRPDAPITRAEAAAVFLRIAGMSPLLNPTSSSFRDVQPMHWAAGYIEAARQAGLLAGYPDNTFRPAELLSRAEFATLASNALGREPTNTNPWVAPENVVQFPDVTRDLWAYIYILEVSTPHTVTNPTRLTRVITTNEHKIPLYTEGADGIITFLRLGDIITAIVPVDGIQADGSDPAARQVKVRIIERERP